jgi:hypothetical protein
MNTHLSNLNSERVEYYTPKWVWECVQQYIPQDKVIWEPFRSSDPGSCRSAEYLRELGFEVENPLCDFFENDYGEICISNPPFKYKRQIMERLFMLDKPFMLILPQIILNTGYYYDMAVKDPRLQIIVLPKRVDFYDPIGNKKTSIHTLIVCWRMNLTNSMIFAPKF